MSGTSTALGRPSSEQHFAMLGQWFDQAPGFFALLRGRQHVFELANQSYLTLVGRDADELIGKPAFDALPEVRGQGFEERLELVWTTRQPFVGRSIPVRLRPQPGFEVTERLLDLLYHPLLDGDGDVEGILVQGHDVTDHVLAERELKQADKNKDDFLAKVAHEVRNPLAPIKTSIHVLRRLVGTAAEAEQRQALDVIDRQTDAIAAFADDLMDLTRIRLGKIGLDIGRVSLQAAVHDAAERCGPLAAAKDQQLRLELPLRDIWVNGDRRRLAQVICNLVNNAVRHAPRQAIIAVALSQTSREAALVVADSGPGIPSELLPTLFELYRQGAGSSRHGGLGIGLALSKQLVEMHDGQVSAARSATYGGAEFTVRIPLADEAAA